ncbi:dihydroneopterin aldolase [Catalinimonas alkaloidigena]|uniref:7,8-dihydroneopterin aldolase n=1 Tax=Catalinimonas alkaloidigena TaxID=1075417 RepID=A0A1G8XKM7_9BACT|nr:dihydroneopterin aldolase [Catalinimonas alkaloidigena]SDJ91212.1 dihydroneopterin aldolase [Catalinimonas alkaloidigena]
MDQSPAPTYHAITLEGMEFYAHHGFYEAEQQLGNRYTVDVTLVTDFTAAADEDDLTGTLNYETVYRIVAEAMEQPSRLLEHVARRILNRLQQTFPTAQHGEVRIAKHNPPLGGLCQLARITLRQSFLSQ